VHRRVGTGLLESRELLLDAVGRRGQGCWPSTGRESEVAADDLRHDGVAAPVRRRQSRVTGLRYRAERGDVEKTSTPCECEGVGPGSPARSGKRAEASESGRPSLSLPRLELEAEMHAEQEA
jgi:hypothetical protein